MLTALRFSFVPHLVNRKVKLSRFVTCWKCGSDVTSLDYFCNNSPCGVIQSLKLSDVNAFHLFHMDPKYFINVAMLESEYKRIQKLLHPDMFVNRPIEEREASMQTSSTINQAYQILKSPLCRAEYILKIQFGINVFEEGKTLSATENNSLMMEVFEVRERISDTSSAADLTRLHQTVQDDIRQIETAFAASVEGGNQSRALHYAVRLKYFKKILEEIELKLPPSH